MTQIERLKKIYKVLLNTSLSKSEILNTLDNEISTRQLDRDLLDIEKNYLRTNEQLITVVTAKHKIFSITPREKKRSIITIENMAILEMLLISNNKELFKGFKKDLNLLDKVKTALLQTYGKEKMTIENEIITSSNFYQLNYDKNFQENILKIYKAIHYEMKISINKILQDTTSENPARAKKNITLFPLKIIFHRGAFHAVVIEKSKIAVYEISQFRDIDILKSTFNLTKYSNQIHKLDERFGISKNTTDKVYNIKLQFSEATGSFVSSMQWHKSQKIKQLANKNYIIELECGINRELMGWIFQWMDNVKIIEPEELKIKYNEVLRKLKDIDKRSKIESVNHF